MSIYYIYTILIVLLVLVVVLICRYNTLSKEKAKYERLHQELVDQMEKEKEKYKEQLFLITYQNRLAQKGQIFNIVAHQWRQPLNTLSILLERCYKARSTSKLDDKLFSDIHTQMCTTIQHMSSTIGEFSNFFKPDKQKKEFVVGEIVDKTLKLLTPILFKEDIKLEKEIEDSVKFVGYPNELGQALINLINNAKEAFASTTVKEKKISLKLTEKEGVIQIVVCDNAGGIDPKLIDKIFEPYFSTKDQKHGIGLGLYISKLVIQEHMGGDLYVENYKDGARFIIELYNKSKS